MIVIIFLITLILLLTLAILENIGKITLGERATVNYCRNATYQDEMKDMDVELSYWVRPDFQAKRDIFKCLEESKFNYSLTIPAGYENDIFPLISRPTSMTLYYNQWSPSLVWFYHITNFPPTLTDLKLENWSDSLPATFLDLSAASCIGLKTITFVNINVDMRALSIFPHLETLKIILTHIPQNVDVKWLSTDNSIRSVTFHPANDDISDLMLPFLLRIPNLEYLRVRIGLGVSATINIFTSGDLQQAREDYPLPENIQQP